ncbi:hypothetical protein CASFOL_007075 [Castilleja foliolosa]|uniref:Uncharacterized protein n=1 Tax=Castilleja foliolosa TaxID=1961234 RepID=A0ABD3E8Y9_9LAMI
MEEEQEINRSLRRKKSSVVGNITSCFNGAIHTQHRRRASLDGSEPFSSSSPVSASHHRKPTTPSAWFKSKTNDLPEIKGRCRNFISRMGRHRRHSSADFSYDPLSYSLNFDDVSPSSSDTAMMDFNARLPVTPPRRTPFQDQHHLPRSKNSGEAGGNDDLRRGFEALSVTIKAKGDTITTTTTTTTPPLIRMR